jgi:transcriptional regulator with XRE-family HTH domain
MVTGTSLKAKRNAAGIAGHILCKKLAIARSRLSDIERGYVPATLEELARIDAALDDLIQAKSVIEQVAISIGWPVPGR